MIIGYHAAGHVEARQLPGRGFTCSNTLRHHAEWHDLWEQLSHPAALPLVADERARAGEERTEAVQLIAEADRLDRAVNPTEDRDRPADVIDQLDREARKRDQDAQRGGDGGDIPNELRAQSANDDQPAQQGSAESTALRGDAGAAYDSAERREAYAASMKGAGVSVEDIAVRMRSSTNQGRPPQDAVTSPSRIGNRTAASHHTPTRTRERGDRSR